MTAELTNPLTRATALYFQNLLMSSCGEPYLWALGRKLRSNNNQAYGPAVFQTADRVPAHDHHRVVWITDRVVAVYTTLAVSSTGIQRKAARGAGNERNRNWLYGERRYVLGKS
jgi:hypothetical protein